MRSLTLHLKILITILVVLGISVTAYQIFVLGIPVTEDATDDLWNIDAKVEFVASPKDPVKISMFVPPLSRDFVSLNESFISNNYGVSVNRTDGNRKVTWSARRAKGNQTLYYRLVLTKRYSGEKVKVKGPTFRDSIAVEGPEKIAAEALLAPIRQHSADVETFITEAIKRTNNLNDDNVKLLLAGDPSTPHKAKIVELLLSIAHVPVEKVHTIRLVADQPQTPELWLRSFNGNDWLYFNPETGEQGLPADRLLWWTGDENLITVDGGKKAMVTFSLNNSEMNAIRLAKLTDENTDANFPADLHDHGDDPDWRAGDSDPAQPDRPADAGHLHPGADRPGVSRDATGLWHCAVHHYYRAGLVAQVVPGTLEAADAAEAVGGADLRGGADCSHQFVQPQAGPGARAVGGAVPDGDSDHDHRTPVDHLGRTRRQPRAESGDWYAVRRLAGAHHHERAGADLLCVHLPGSPVDPGGFHAGHGSLSRLPPDRTGAFQGLPQG
jgi:hypothetical protein